MDAATRVVEDLSPDRRRYLDFARARVGDDAEDVLQIAFLRAALRAETLGDPARVRAWFFAILRHAIADHRSRVGRLAIPSADLDEEPAPADPPRDVCRCPAKLLDALPPAYGAILRRVDVEDESVEEAAAALGITANNASVRLHRARKAMREALVEACATTSTRACFDCACD